MVNDQKENKFLTEKRKFMGIIASGVTFSFGGLTWARDKINEDEKWSEENLDPAIGQFLDDLQQVDYGKIATGPEGVDFSEYSVDWDGNGLTLSFETPYLAEDIAESVESGREFYENPAIAEDEAVTVMGRGQYLEEGSDLFGIIAENFEDVSGLDEIRVEYTTDIDDLNSLGVSYAVSTEEISDDAIQQYREELVDGLEG